MYIVPYFLLARFLWHSLHQRPFITAEFQTPTAQSPATILLLVYNHLLLVIGYDVVNLSGNSPIINLGGVEIILVRQYVAGFIYPHCKAVRLFLSSSFFSSFPNSKERYS